MKKIMFLSKNWYFSIQKALIYYTFNKSHHYSFILLVFSHVANFRYVANFRFLTLHVFQYQLHVQQLFDLFLNFQVILVNNIFHCLHIKRIKNREIWLTAVMFRSQICIDFFKKFMYISSKQTTIHDIH